MQIWGYADLGLDKWGKSDYDRLIPENNSEEEEYRLIPDRENCSLAGRRFKKVGLEGSFGVGILKSGV